MYISPLAAHSDESIYHSCAEDSVSEESEEDSDFEYPPSYDSDDDEEIPVVEEQEQETSNTALGPVLGSWIPNSPNLGPSTLGPSTLGSASLTLYKEQEKQNVRTIASVSRLPGMVSTPYSFLAPLMTFLKTQRLTKKIRTKTSGFGISLLESGDSLRALLPTTA